MGQVKKITPLTERFITEYNRLDEAGKLPANTELAEIMGIATPSTISNILAKKQNIRADAWEAFREKFRISEDDGNGQPDPSKVVLTGAHVTLQDYINKIEQHNVFLQYVIQNGLVSLETNLKTGQHQIKEQIFVSTDALQQQLEGISEGLAAQAKHQEVVKKDISVAGKQRSNDGKGKGH